MENLENLKIEKDMYYSDYMTFQYTDISLTEIPNSVSLVIYNPQCFLSCPWCFNTDLRNKKALTWKQIKDAIDEHSEFIDGVVFSGGEPLMNNFLIKGIKYAKDKGLKVKLNTNGLIVKNMTFNMCIPYIDYLHISIKGTFGDYESLLMKPVVESLTPCCDVLEYSFVYSPSFISQTSLYFLHTFLRKQISFDWRTMFTHRWSHPDIFTISQMQTGNCLNAQYNDCRIPTREECIEVAKIFSDIPKKKVIVETKEFGRETIYKK